MILMTIRNLTMVLMVRRSRFLQQYIMKYFCVANNADIPDEDPDLSNSPWGWDEPDAHLTAHGHRHHGRFRGVPPPWNIFPGGLPSRHGIIPIPAYRSHRSQVQPRGNDDGTNPLLRRTDRPAELSGQGRGPSTE